MVFPGEVPQCDINGANAHPVMLTKCRFCLVVEPLTLKGTFADEEVGDHSDLFVGCRCASYVFAGHADIGMDFDAYPTTVTFGAGLVELPHRPAGISGQVVGRCSVSGEFDSLDFRCIAHGTAFSRGVFCSTAHRLSQTVINTSCSGVLA